MQEEIILKYIASTQLLRQPHKDFRCNKIFNEVASFHCFFFHGEKTRKYERNNKSSGCRIKKNVEGCFKIDVCFLHTKHVTIGYTR